jgi:NADPH:quinone reductase-like Zn-dependent oxidoreductase
MALPESNTSLTYTTPSSQPHLTHTPLPKPGPKEILVKIHAAAINPVDIQLWGNPVIGWLAGTKEKGIGRDYSGEIVGVGEECKGWEIGDEVFGLCNRPVRLRTLDTHVTFGIVIASVCYISYQRVWNKSLEANTITICAYRWQKELLHTI